MLRTSIVAAVVVVLSASVLSGCGLIGPTNAFDPDAPAETQARGALTVSVVDINGATLTTGVTVTVEGAAADFEADLDGDVFKAIDLVPGAYAVVVRQPSFAPVTRDVELGAGVTRALLVVLSPLGDEGANSGTVSGTARKESQVTELAADHSGVVVEVLVEGTTTGIRAITNAAGRYDLTLLAGSYSLAFTAPDHEPQDRADVVVAAGGVLELDPVTLEVNPGSIDGTVLLEDLDPGDGVAPSSAGATISLVGGAVTTTAAADGTFRITGLPPGTQALRFAFATYAAVEVPVVVRAGSTAAIAAVTLQRERGTIFGVVDVTGAPDVSGVLVEAEGAGVADVTGVDGSFTLTVPTGTYDVTASKLGARRARAAAVVVAAGAVVDAGVLTLAPNIGVLVINDDSGLTNDADVTLVLDEDDAVSVRASEDPAFGDVDFVAYPSDGRLAFALSAGDGDKSVFVQVRDALGDVRQLQGDVALDTTPPELEAVVVDSGSGITTSLSITVSVLGSGADEMAVATDGTIDSEAFAPFAPTSVALLPPTDAVKSVCVELRDRADNRAGPVCVTVQLETVVPIAPRVLLLIDNRLQNVDVVTLNPVAAAALRVFFTPFGGANADVVAIEASLESPDVTAGGVRETFEIPCAPGLGGLVTCDDDDEVPGVSARALTAVDGADDTRPSLLVARARDLAGNLSSATSLLVVVDDKLPTAPTPTNAACDVPPASCAANIYRARSVNADSFTLRLREQPFAIDRTFTEYRIAQTVGDDVTVLPGEFEPTASVDNIVFALAQGAPLNGVNDNVTCNPLSCENHLFIVAVDAAGNNGPVVRIDVLEDSSPPTRPILAPAGGLQRGATTLVRLGEPARDRLLVGTDGDPVTVYEIKEGIDGAFEGVPALQPPTGPWELELLTAADNEVCIRGVDSAGNIGIEDCILVEEGSIRHPVATEQGEKQIAIAGDLVMASFNSNVLVSSLSSPDITNSADVTPIGSFDHTFLRSARRLDRTTGVDVVDLLVDRGQGGGPDEMQVYLGLTNNPVLTPRRSICGRSGDTDGLSFAFARGTNIMSASRAQVQAVSAQTVATACTNVGVVVAAINGGLCQGTGVRVDGNVVVWCEGAGNIRRSIGGAAPVMLLPTGAQTLGTLFQPANGDFQQPQVTSTATFFTSGTTLRRTAHTSTAATNTTISPAQLDDAEGERVALLEVNDDGVGIDVFVADFSRSPVGVLQVTDDVNPQQAAMLDGNRIAYIDFAALSEDAAVADLTSSRWVVASPASELQSAAGTDLTVWAGASTSLAVFARATGGPNGTFDDVVAELDLAVPANSIFTFFGGTALGPPTVGAAGRSVLLLKKDAVNYSLRAIDIDGDLTPTVISSQLLPIDAGGEDATAAYGASPDGGALVFLDAARALRFGRLTPAGVASTTVLMTAPVVPVPFVDTELDGNVGTTVVQLGNTGGDLRRTATGALTCIAHDAAGVVTNAARTIRRNGVDLTTGRAPVIASVEGRVFMGYQEGVGTMRNRVCELDCSAVAAATCSNDVPLGIPGDLAPRISRAGLVAWVTLARSNFGDVAAYDVRADRAILLTGVNGEEAPRFDVDVNGDRVIWTDGRLGGLDVWEAVQP
ncbi:MAG: carboxypeptidase-like regulatory domain-containing protein [Deltaproteobacteria bacterium]|nr:carboxypeptidase-like regulatory domain-containing protein [Deltaproteobacteria bacterium]